MSTFAYILTPSPLSSRYNIYIYIYIYIEREREREFYSIFSRIFLSKEWRLSVFFGILKSRCRMIKISWKGYFFWMEELEKGS